MRKVLVTLMAALVAIPLLTASAALPDGAAVQKTAAYIRTTQQPDGGFGGFGDGQSYDAIYALRAAGIDPNAVSTNGKTPVDFLKAKASAADKPNIAAKAALAARASGLNPRSVAGVDLIAVINKGYSQATGKFEEDDFSQSLAMIGLACTGNAVPNGAILALRGTQLTSGGWGFGGFADPDTTAIAIQALIESGIPVTDSSVSKALAYLKSTQAADGGWGFDPTASNANSTAFVLQALIAAGEAPESVTYTKGGKTPVSFILSQQQADGSFAGFDPAFASNQVLPAIAGRTFCNAVVTPIVNQPAVTPTSAPTTAPSVVPLPPKTGSGVDAGGGMTFLPLLAGALALAAAGAAFAWSGRRK